MFLGTASSLICVISSLVTDANRDAIFLPSCSEVNSTGYPEFDEPIRARLQRYPLFQYILISNIIEFEELGSSVILFSFFLNDLIFMIIDEFNYMHFCYSQQNNKKTSES